MSDIPSATHMPGVPVDALGDTSPPSLGTSSPAVPYCGDRLEACGIAWDAYDLTRFLSFCDEYVSPHDGHTHLLWRGGRSRGRGNTAWYGTFTAQGKSVRAHKFYGVAFLGLRPKSGIHHLDHFCPDSLCVSCIRKEVEAINLKLRWIRVQVGLDEDKVRDAVTQYLAVQEPDWFDDYHPQDFAHWITDHNRWRFAPDHPLQHRRMNDDDRQHRTD